MKRNLLAPLVVLLALLAPGPARAAPQTGASEAPQRTEGALIRIGGDAELPAGRRIGLVLVIDGDAHIAGTARSLVVVNGTADVAGGTVLEDVVVVNGAAEIRAGTVIGGDLQLIGSTLERASDSTIGGAIVEQSTTGWERGFFIFGLLFTIGFAVALVLAGLAAAGVAGPPLRRAGAALTGELGRTVLSSLILWLLVPLIAGGLLFTVIGIPTALGVFALVLPLLGFLGYLVAGVRLGDVLYGWLFHRVEAQHPYRAAAIGLAVLVLIGWIPGLGPIVTVVAAILGGGAVLLAAWRTAVTPRRHRFAAPEASP